VVLLGHVDTDEHLDVPMIELPHVPSFEFSVADARTVRPPSTTVARQHDGTSGAPV
jgi:hypothetical protein